MCYIEYVARYFVAMQILLNGIIIGGAYAIMAIGFNLIFSSVRFFHLLYGILAVLGVYMTIWLIAIGINFFPAAFLAAIVVGFISQLFWKFLYQPLVQKKPLSWY